MNDQPSAVTSQSKFQRVFKGLVFEAWHISHGADSVRLSDQRGLDLIQAILRGESNAATSDTSSDVTLSEVFPDADEDEGRRNGGFSISSSPLPPDRFEPIRKSAYDRIVSSLEEQAKTAQIGGNIAEYDALRMQIVRAREARSETTRVTFDGKEVGRFIPDVSSRAHDADRKAIERGLAAITKAHPKLGAYFSSILKLEDGRWYCSDSETQWDTNFLEIATDEWEPESEDPEVLRIRKAWGSAWLENRTRAHEMQTRILHLLSSPPSRTDVHEAARQTVAECWRHAPNGNRFAAVHQGIRRYRQRLR